MVGKGSIVKYQRCYYRVTRSNPCEHSRTPDGPKHGLRVSFPDISLHFNAYKNPQGPHDAALSARSPHIEPSSSRDSDVR